jgi:hypothetical protein
LSHQNGQLEGANIKLGAVASAIVGLPARRGRKRAVVATAHRILELAHYLLTRREDDCAPGPDYDLARDRRALKRRPHP